MDHILYLILEIKYIFKKHETVTNGPSIMIYVNRIENRITFKIKTGYYIELLMPETIKLLGSTKSKVNKDKNGENVPHFEITELVLVHCNITNNYYQQELRVLYTSVLNKSFAYLLNIPPRNFIFSKTFDLEFEVRFTDQNPKPLEIEGK